MRRWLLPIALISILAGALQAQPSAQDADARLAEARDAKWSGRLTNAVMRRDEARQEVIESEAAWSRALTAGSRFPPAMSASMSAAISVILAVCAAWAVASWNQDSPSFSSSSTTRPLAPATRSTRSRCSATRASVRSSSTSFESRYAACSR